MPRSTTPKRRETNRKRSGTHDMQRNREQLASRRDTSHTRAQQLWRCDSRHEEELTLIAWTAEAAAQAFGPDVLTASAHGLASDEWWWEEGGCVQCPQLSSIRIGRWVQSYMTHEQMYITTSNTSCTFGSVPCGVRACCDGDVRSLKEHESQGAT